jgi:hypothetical protein
MKPEWMPENPYTGEIDIFQNIRLATKQGFEAGSIVTAEAIFKYLIKNRFSGQSEASIMERTFLENMLKSLREKRC